MRSLRPLLFVISFAAIVAAGVIVGRSLQPGPLESAMAEMADRSLLEENTRSFEHELTGALGSWSRDDFLGLVRQEASNAPNLTPDAFRTLLNEAYAFTALGEPLRIENVEQGIRDGQYRLSTHRADFGVHGTSVGWTVHRFRSADSLSSAPQHRRAIFILPGAKADMSAMLDRSQSDFMNQLAARASRHADVWVLDPLTDLRAAADANAKLTMVDRQLEGLRARTVCEIAGQVAADYPEGLLLWGVRDGARTAEIVNVLCDVTFARVAIDALPVPLDTYLAQRFLALTIGEIGGLQTVGPFWGRHAWTDFPAASRNPTVYFLTRSDLAAAQAWEQTTPWEESSPHVAFVEKNVEYGLAEFSRLRSFMDGEAFTD